MVLEARKATEMRKNIIVRKQKKMRIK